MEQLTERKVTFFRFEDLRLYHKALDYITWVHDAAGQELDGNKGSLVEKLHAAAQSIAMNIAEGSSRNKSQFIYYLKLAKTAIRESLVYTSILRKVEILDEVQEEESRSFLIELTKMLGALITSLQRNNSNSNQHSPNEY